VRSAVLALALVGCRSSSSAATTTTPAVSPVAPTPASAEPTPTPTPENAAVQDPADDIEEQAAKLLAAAHCRENPDGTQSAVFLPIVRIDLQIGASGEVVRADADDGPAPRAVSECDVALLRGHRFQRTDGGTGILNVEIVTPRGALDKDIIRRVVRAHLNEVRGCYNQGLERDRTMKGRVAIQFTIGPDGRVPVAEVATTELKDVEVGQCIADAVKRWTFPAPEGGGNVVVTYPFLLEAG
jgi:TonB family protein